MATCETDGNQQGENQRPLHPLSLRRRTVRAVLIILIVFACQVSDNAAVMGSAGLWLSVFLSLLPLDQRICARQQHRPMLRRDAVLMIRA